MLSWIIIESYMAVGLLEFIFVQAHAWKYIFQMPHGKKLIYERKKLAGHVAKSQ